MAVICPTVTAFDAHDYRQQVERVADFAERIHLDLMDGVFTKTKSPKLDQVWWPHGIRADLHLMYQRPDLYLEQIIHLEPQLVIIHAEAEGNFGSFADRLHQADIRVGVALLESTEAELIRPALNNIDHVLIFSGSLGRFGGEAHLKLLGKILKLKQWKPSIEIGWDGGVNDKNARQLMKGQVDVLNVGGFIQRSSDPAAAYAKLVAEIEIKDGQKTHP